MCICAGGRSILSANQLKSTVCRAAQVQMRLAEALSTEWLRNCMTSSPRRTSDAVDLQSNVSGGSAANNTVNTRMSDRINQVQLLDSLDEEKPSRHSAGVAGKLTGASLLCCV